MKILLIRLSSLGDIVLTSGVVSSLKKRFPNSSLFFLAKKEYSKIIELFSDVDRILSFDKKEGLFPLIKRIRKEKFDILIDLSANPRSKVISILSGAKKRLSYKKPFLKRFLLLFNINLFKEPIHISKRYSDSLSDIGIRYEMPHLSLSKVNKEKLLEKFGIHQGLFCAIACGSQHKNKEWSIEGYAQLIEKLSKEFNCSIILLGNENDKALAGRIKAMCRVAIKDLVGKTDLAELACLIERSFLFISPDTGAMHIADSLGVPVVALFGPTTRHFGFFPLKGAIVEKELSCRPCSFHGGNRCRMADHRCMKRITVDDVMNAIDAILNKKPYLGDKPDKILVVETAFLGDCLLTTPLIRGIKEVFPDSSISFLARPIGCETLRNNPCIASFIPYDKKKGILEFLKIAKKIKNEGFGLAILPHRSMRTTLLAFFCKIPKRIGFDNASLSFLLTEKIPYDRRKHEAERKISLIKGFIKVKDERGLDIFINEKARKKRDSLFFKWNIKKDDLVVGILPFSHWKTKMWLERGFAKVIDRLSEYKAKAIIFGSLTDLQSAYKIQAMAREKPIIACGDILISELGAFFERCDLIIGNDTGIIHIAYGLNKKTVVIFGPTTPELGFGPYKTTSTIILQKPLPCRPCSSHGPMKCPKAHFHCMREITDEDVIKACLNLLK